MKLQILFGDLERDKIYFEFKAYIYTILSLREFHTWEQTPTSYVITMHAFLLHKGIWKKHQRPWKNQKVWRLSFINNLRYYIKWYIIYINIYYIYIIYI